MNLAETGLWRRRTVLRAATSALATQTLVPAAQARTRKLRLGLADLTVIRELGRDYAGTLRKVADMGYGYFGFRLKAGQAGSELGARQKADLVRAAGLEVGAVRFPPINADYSANIAQAAAIGAPVISMTAAPVFLTRQIGVATRAQFDAWLPKLAELGRRCRESGVRLAYHTHWWDFLPMAEGGGIPVDLIVQGTSPADVGFEVDLAWCWYAGQAPLDVLARLGPRVASMHFKDIDRTRGRTETDHAVVIGSGEMDYAALLPRIARLTRAIGYVEVDMPTDGLAAAAAAARFFKDNR